MLALLPLPLPLTASDSDLDSDSACTCACVDRYVCHHLNNIFQDVILKLEHIHSLSFSGQYLLALAIIQYADIRCKSVSCGINYLQDRVMAYTQAASVLLNQVTTIIT